jgi:outer membrane protein OmpA-like peptidoglycan-associated protein
MAKKCGKCDPHEICEECPEWIFTLADLIMCMMGLFVILWVLKPGTTTPPPPAVTAQGKQVSNFDLDMILFQAGMQGVDPETLAGGDPVLADLIRKRQKLGHGQGGETTQKRETPPGTDEMNSAIRPGKEAIVGGRLLFEAGGTRFLPETSRNLKYIADEIKGHRNIVLVKGHTSLDDLPDDASPEEKMKLSLQRAQSVADYLTSQGVEPEILRVQGCSTFEPVKQRAYTPDSILLNRRVEVITTATLVEDLQDRSKTSSSTEPAPLSKEAHEHH